MQILKCIPQMVKAIEDELEIIKTRKIGKNINIYNGYKKESEDNQSLYTFELAEEKKLFEDSPVKIHFKTTTIEGSILGTQALSVTLSLNSDPTESIDEAILEEDITSLYLKMIERLNYLKDNPKQFNIDQAESLFFSKPQNKTQNKQSKINFKEIPNSSQLKAINNSLSYPISCIWGPPGTGKTKTLSQIVAEHLKLKKTILVVAHANRAVDNALYAVLKLLAGINITHQDQQKLITRYASTLLSKISDINLKEFSFIEQIDTNKKQLDQDRIFYKTLLIKFESLQQAVSQISERQILVDKAEKINHQVKKVQKSLQKYSDLSSKNKLKILLKGHERQTLEKHASNLIETQSALVAKISDIDQKLKHKGLNHSQKDIQIQLDQIKQTIDQSGGIEAITQKSKVQSKINVEQILEKKQIIFTTLTKLATDESFKRLRFDTVIIDEASMAPLPLIAIAASLSREHLVFAGDPQQLPPISLADSESSKVWLSRDIFMQTSKAQNTTELFNWQQKNPNVTFLDTQYRMPQTLSNLVSKYFYQSKIKNANANLGQNAIQIIDSSDFNPICQKDTRPNSQSRANPTHLQFIINSLHDLSYNYSSYDIGIISPYRLQLSLIRKMLTDNRLSGVEAGTIHTFQGREKKVIIFDTTDSPPMRPGILLDENSSNGDSALKVLTVAFSRAQEKLIIIANVNYFKLNLKGRKLTQILVEHTKKI